MHYYYSLYFVLLNLLFGEALFFWKDKPVFFCFKVCPLYCSKDSNRRYDEESSFLLHNIKKRSSYYEPEFWVEDFPHFPPPYYYGHWIQKTTEEPKTTTTTTTEAPTTTPEPTYICIVCEKKCGYRGMKI